MRNYAPEMLVKADCGLLAVDPRVCARHVSCGHWRFWNAILYKGVVSRKVVRQFYLTAFFAMFLINNSEPFVFFYAHLAP